MNNKTLHEHLIEELKARVPNNSELVNKLCDILCLGKEAIYRRMRGDVHFSLEEASILAEKMGISLDILNGISSLKRPFVFKIANFADPDEIDYKMVNEYVEILANVKNNPEAEIGTAAKLIPDALHLTYPHITRFYLFKWIYQYDNDNVKKFEFIRGTDRILEILGNMANYIQEIKSAYYIFDRRIFEYFVDDIKYFKSIGLVSRDDIELLKADLNVCIDDIEMMAARGTNRLGNKTEIYLSNLNFEAGFSYIKSNNYLISTVRAFTMYDISSNDKLTFENSLKWMQSLKRASMLISQSGEIARMNFFNRQREIINTL